MNRAIVNEDTKNVYQSVRNLVEYYNKFIVKAYQQAKLGAEEELKKSKRDAEDRLKEVNSRINFFKGQCGMNTIPADELNTYLKKNSSFVHDNMDVSTEIDQSIELTSEKYSSFANWKETSPFLIRLVIFILVFFILLLIDAGFLSIFIALIVSAVAPSLYNKQKRTDSKESFYNSAAKTQLLMDKWVELEKEKLQNSISMANSNFQAKLNDINEHMLVHIEEFNRLYSQLFKTFNITEVPWISDQWGSWSVMHTNPDVLRIGDILLDTSKINKINPKRELDYILPALISFSNGRGLLLRSSGSKRQIAINAVQSMIFRLLGTTTPGKMKFLFIDPVGLGQNVSSFMPLSDYEESLITNRAWSEPQHIEKQLADITEHMETIIQKYLRSEFDNIEQYNLSAGAIAEPYVVVVVMDFPVGFSEVAARRLQSIAQNGPRCGVYTIIVNDIQKELPYGFNMDDLERACEVISCEKDSFKWKDSLYEYCTLELDQPPTNELSNSIIAQVGEQAGKSMIVEVPFPKLLNMANLDEDSWWSGSVNDMVSIPLGPAGAKKVQNLSLGAGTAQHVLVVGRTGSGKSNLMHIIITSASLLYSPNEINFYIIDFKEGVEFKPYADPPLPHIRVLAIESEREFGLSVLQGLDKELKRRGEAFREIGVNSLAEYRRVSGIELPRIILLVDEFQIFFVRDDTISNESGLILDGLVRQGRSFGMHVILSSQTLAGSYSLPRATLDQMQIRIALQSSDADSRLILAEDNPAARLLSRPGEAIYNAASGLVEGNNLFQVALFSEDDRIKHLEKVYQLRQKYSEKEYSIIVFEGHKPAKLDDSKPIQDLLNQNSWSKDIKPISLFLGEPIAIRPSTTAKFRQQSGSNLLVVTREEAEGVGLMISSIISLATQVQTKFCRFVMIDFCSADATWADLPGLIKDTFPHEVDRLRRRDLPGVLSNLVSELEQRQNNETKNVQSIFIIVLGLQRARDLREEAHGIGIGAYKENNTPSLNEQFSLLLRDGPEVGIHICCWCDTYSNLTKVVDRRIMNEFTMRAVGKMNDDDSRNLLEDPAASRLNKPHRMVYYDDDMPGYIETFRPYSIPNKEWLKKVGQNLNKRII